MQLIGQAHAFVRRPGIPRPGRVGHGMAYSKYLFDTLHVEVKCGTCHVHMRKWCSKTCFE